MMLKESDRLVGKVKQAVTSLCGQSVCFLFVILASKSEAVGMLEWTKSNSLFVHTWSFFLYHNLQI